MAGSGARSRQRTCIGCKAKAEKSRLLRIVACKDGSVRFDASGKGAGRGAYVCSAACLEDAIAKGALQRSLRVKPSAEDTLRVRMDIVAACAGEE